MWAKLAQEDDEALLHRALSRPSERPSKSLGKNTLYKLLTNPYCAGVIRYKGALHPGAHEPLVEPALFG